MHARWEPELLRSSEESAETSHSKPWRCTHTRQGAGQKASCPKGKRGTRSTDGAVKATESLGPLMQTEELDGCLRDHSSHNPSAPVWAAELANHKVAVFLPITRSLWLMTSLSQPLLRAWIVSWMVSSKTLRAKKEQQMKKNYQSSLYLYFDKSLEKLPELEAVLLTALLPFTLPAHSPKSPATSSVLPRAHQEDRKAV